MKDAARERRRLGVWSSVRHIREASMKDAARERRRAEFLKFVADGDSPQ